MFKFLEFFSSYKIRNEKKRKSQLKFLDKYFNIRTTDEVYLKQSTLGVITARRYLMLVGVSVFFTENGKLHLNYTAVDTKHRNIGINKLMKKELISYAKGKNISKITANVRESNIFSVKSLISSGFKLDNENTTKYENGDNKLLFYLFI